MVKKRITSVIAPLVMFLLVFGIWELLCRVNETPAWFLPTPTAIFTAMVVNFNEYLPHILVTLEVVLIGFLITIPVGLLLATLITRSPIISAALNPYVTFLVTTPMICLIPLLMLMLGYGLTLRPRPSPETRRRTPRRSSRSDGPAGRIPKLRPSQGRS